MTNSKATVIGLLAAMALGIAPAAAEPRGSGKNSAASCSPGEHLAAWLASVVTDNWCKGSVRNAKSAEVSQVGRGAGKAGVQPDKGKGA